MSKKIIVSLGLFGLSLVFLVTGAVYTRAQGAPGIPPVVPSTDPFEICMGKALAKYMNTAIELSKGLNNIRFVSPAFNLTNPQEFQIYQAMRTAGANFSALDAFSGNTYSNVGDTRSAYAWFVSNGWKGAFGGKPMIFTEFGDFNKPPDQGQMVTDFKEAAADGTVISINYFNILGNNPDPNFAFHVLGPQVFRNVTNGNGKAGINSATWVSGGGFQQQAGAAGAAWTVEILGGVGDIDRAAASVNAANNIVLRLCASGDTCAFSDPATLALFLHSLNGRINKPVYVIIGPNEPATEKWAGPQCKPSTKPFVLEEIPCNQVVDPEFHSLRPYPTSPCNRSVETSYYQCGQDLVVKEKFEFTPGGNCSQPPGLGVTRCNYTINSTADISLGLSRSDFPIMGNTELVPNGENKGTPTSKLSFLQRVNEYVSWYLNGIPFRAEEKPTDENTKVEGKTSIGINIDLGGPLKKLLPNFIQTQERKEEDLATFRERHNQIVECGGANPEACYSDSVDYVRLHDAVSQGEKSKPFPYVPFSSTEDRVGQANIGPNIAEGSCNGFVNNPSNLGVLCADFKPDIESRKLYFAHIEEDNKLGQLLQNTFKPNNIEETVENKQHDELNSTPFCELLESRRNPGDRLYGELARNNETKPISGTLQYTANFQCDFAIPDPTQIALCVANCSPTDLACVAKCSNPDQRCQREVFIPFSVKSFTPELETTWERFVNGNMSLVKRIFPRVGADTPIEELKDIPGETSASYLSQNQGVTGGELLSSEALAGNPAQNRSGSTAKLFFPHIGSVYDYFLKGVQKALRPKDIADTTGGLPPGTAQCTVQGSGVQSNGLLKIISDAAQWAHVPVEVLITTVRVEGRCRDNTGPGTVCGLTDAEVATYSQPGVEYPVNCPGGGTDANADGRAKGPLQFYHRIDTDWGIWRNAVNTATNEGRTTNICNIKDAIYAAAYSLSATMANNNHCPTRGYNVSLTKPASSWSTDDKKWALTRWAGGCSIGLCGEPNGLSGNPGEAFAATYCNYLGLYSTQITTDCNSNGPIGTGKVPSSGYCSVEHLLPYFGNDPTKARNAACICSHESGSNPQAINRGCQTGRSVDYSIGLFQINLLAHCPASGPSYTWTPPSCSFRNESARLSCENELLDPDANIKRAVLISSNGTNWRPWSTAPGCGL